ncbi:MAG: hypothetical protein EBR82_11905 [Caulobacteraceae bacterium]|nr:hypothetical protein [Caulobacteraceae bacterium]
MIALNHQLLDHIFPATMLAVTLVPSLLLIDEIAVLLPHVLQVRLIIDCNLMRHQQLGCLPNVLLLGQLRGLLPVLPYIDQDQFL